MRKPRINVSKQAAQMRVRNILGNQGAIRQDKAGCYVGTDDGAFHAVASGRDWDDAISNIPKEISYLQHCSSPS